MSGHRASYWKTTTVAAIVSAVLFALVPVAGIRAIRPGTSLSALERVGWSTVGVVALAAGAAALLTAAGGVIALRRDALEATGEPLHRSPAGPQAPDRPTE